MDRSVRPGYISFVTIDNGAEVIRAVGSSSFTQLNVGYNKFYVGGVPSSVVPTKILGPGEQVSTPNTYNINHCCCTTVHPKCSGMHQFIDH